MPRVRSYDQPIICLHSLSLPMLSLPTLPLPCSHPYVIAFHFITPHIISIHFVPLHIVTHPTPPHLLLFVLSLLMSSLFRPLLSHQNNSKLMPLCFLAWRGHTSLWLTSSINSSSQDTKKFTWTFSCVQITCIITVTAFLSSCHSMFNTRFFVSETYLIIWCISKNYCLLVPSNKLDNWT